MANEIDEIRARWAKATPGPWKLDDPDGDRNWVPVIPGDSTFRADFARVWEVGVPRQDGLTGWRFVEVPTTQGDAEAIAHAPADIDTVLTAYDAERALREALEEQLRAAERDRDDWKELYEEDETRLCVMESERDVLREELTRAKAKAERERDELDERLTAHARASAEVHVMAFDAIRSILGMIYEDGTPYEPQEVIDAVRDLRDAEPTAQIELAELRADLESQLARAKAEGAREALERAEAAFRGFALERLNHADRLAGEDRDDPAIRVLHIKGTEAGRCADWCEREAARLAGEEPSDAD